MNARKLSLEKARWAPARLLSGFASGWNVGSAPMEKPNIRDAEQRTQTICLLILCAIAIGVALMQLRQVLLPFVLALFLTMAVTPVMDFLIRRFRFPRGAAIAATFLIASSVLAALGGLVSTALADVLEKKETYVAQIDGLITEAEETFVSMRSGFDGIMPGSDEDSDVGPQDGAEQGPEEGAEEEAGEDAEGAARTEGGEEQPTETNPADAQGAALDAPDQTPPTAVSPFDDLREKVAGMTLGAIGWAVNNTLALLSKGLLVMVFMMFLITGYRSQEERDPNSLGFQLRARVKEYLRVKIIVSAMTGFATFLILNLLGVDLALVFGLMAFFLNFIPNVGSAVAILLPLPVILLAPTELLPIWAKALGIALPATVQFLVGNVLEPRWMGKSLDLNPIVILLSLIFWGVLWGPVGMLLSVPITAVIKILLERSELTRPVAVLFSDGD